MSHEYSWLQSNQSDELTSQKRNAPFLPSILNILTYTLWAVERNKMNLIYFCPLSLCLRYMLMSYWNWELPNEEICIKKNVTSKSNTLHSLQRMGHACITTERVGVGHFLQETSMATSTICCAQYRFTCVLWYCIGNVFTVHWLT